MSPLKPVFLLAGGHPLDQAKLVAGLARALTASEVSRPRVAYIGTASQDNRLFFLAVKTLLHRAGASQVNLVRLARPNADIPAAKAALAAADVLFLSGGEVEDGISWLTRHGLADYLRELYAQGKLFCGISAGSIMLGRCWVRWANPADDATAEIFTCLGLVPVIFDTHAEDEDWRELKTALRLLGPGSDGYGIPQDGMISADRAGRLIDPENALLHFVNRDGQVRRA